MKFSSNTTPKPRYRTIQECHDELVRLDKDCKISTNFIRNLCRQNKIEYFTIGVKIIINLDNLLSYLGFSSTAPLTETSQTVQQAKNSKYRKCFEYGNIVCDRL